MNYTYKSVSGRRELNEDCCSIHPFDDGSLLFIVADGMGGHAAGEVASSMLIENLPQAFQCFMGQYSHAEALKKAIRNCNLDIFRYSESSNGCKGMGSTLVCAEVHNMRATIANVGDSRLYHFHDNTLYRITKDHSLVQTLIDEGTITEDEAKIHPMRNVITRAIGSSIYVDTDIFEVGLSIGDKLLLCSDGLHGSLEDDMIGAILRQSLELQQMCDALIKAAYTAGSRDNISVLLVDVCEEVLA